MKGSLLNIDTKGSHKISGVSLCMLVVAVLALAGCGETKMERGLSGAGIGAGVGAAGAAVTDGNIGRGAIIGGAVGGAAGVLTDKETLDLGDF